jgi:hypothetical protein
MIEDLKLDSARWEAERRAAPLGRPMNGIPQRDSGGTRSSNAHPAPSYIESQTHESRQYYGPRDGPPQPQGIAHPGPSQERYIIEPQYAPSQPSQSYIQPSSTFDSRQSGPQGSYPIHNEPSREYYVPAGAHYDIRTQGGRIPASQGETIPRGEVYMHGGPGPSYQPQDRGYSGFGTQIPVSSAPPFASQQQDQYYIRRA